MHGVSWGGVQSESEAGNLLSERVVLIGEDRPQVQEDGVGFDAGENRRLGLSEPGGKFGGRGGGECERATVDCLIRERAAADR